LVIYYSRKPDEFVHSVLKTSIMHKSVLLFVVCFFSFCALAQNGKELIKVTDMLKVKTVGGINASKDGSKVVFTVTAIEPDGDAKWEYKYVNQV